jgi:hypothetical protein
MAVKTGARKLNLLPILQPDDDLVYDAEEIGEALSEAERPKKRSQCVDGPRPCPWVSCRYNLYLDVRGDGILRFNFPGKEPHEVFQSCALDLAEDGLRTLEQVALLMGMSKERARQIEEVAFDKLQSQIKEKYPKTGLDDLV